MFRLKYVLIRTDGYDIHHQTFSSESDAIDKMKTEYVNLDRNPKDSNEHEMSHIDNCSAVLYDRGINVFVWKIIIV